MSLETMSQVNSGSDVSADAADSGQESTANKSASSSLEQDESAEESDASGVKDDASDESDSDESEEESSEKPKRKNGFKRRIDKLNARLTDRERELEYWKQEAIKSKKGDDAEAHVKATPKAEGKPHPNDFDSHEDWVEAVADWKADQKLAQRDAKTREEQVRAEHQKQVQSHVERVKAFAEKHEDFQDRMEDVDDIPMSVTVQETILSSDIGAELMYELAGDPEEFARICKLPALQAARALGRIEARILSGKESAKPKAEIKTSKAPRPLSPVNAKSGSVSKSIHDPNLSFAEYEKIRREQLKTKR